MNSINNEEPDNVIRRASLINGRRRPKVPQFSPLNGGGRDGVLKHPRLQQSLFQYRHDLYSIGSLVRILIPSPLHPRNVLVERFLWYIT